MECLYENDVFYNPLLSPFVKGEFDYVPYFLLEKGGKGVVSFFIALTVAIISS